MIGLCNFFHRMNLAISFTPPKKFTVTTIFMENLHFHNLFFSLILPYFLLVSSPSSAYTVPDKYFFNCGSGSDAVVNLQTYVGDLNSNSNFSVGESSTVRDGDPFKGTSLLYQTARIYRDPSGYEFRITENGTYLVRLHFYPFSSPRDLSAALFNVSASRKNLLSNFSVRKGSNLPVIEEFLLTIEVGRFKIYFIPSQETSFAFINAIEVFIAPQTFISDKAALVTPAGSSTTYSALPSQVLHPIHRINVGGQKVTPDNDTLLRNWIPDDVYLFFKGAARNSDPYSGRPNYQYGGSDAFIAPDFVYRTAKELNINSNRTSNFFNITWRFGVNKNVRHLVRVHFCDIISPSLNTLRFNLYIGSEFSQKIDPYDIIGSLATPSPAIPFYIDFVVDSDDSGFMNISIGPRRDSMMKTAFLNGLEIMELLKEPSSLVIQSKSRKKHLPVIVGSVVGGVTIVGILIVGFFLGLKYRRAKPIQTLGSPSLPLYVGTSSHSKMTETTANPSPVPNLNLGLKIPLAEILHATNNFDKKLKIGEGGFGKVYRGTLRNGVKVAVKRSQPGHGQGLPEFQTEIMVLSKIRHRHLVSLIGYCDDRFEMILVYEFMEKGTLRDHLYNSNENFNKKSTQSALSWKQRLEICIGSAQGLHYLHTGSDGGIIHRDVKSTNILLDEYYVAKVADFGLSRSGPLDQTHVSTDVKGSFGYLDPEYFRCLQLTEKSDVYSFGVVLLEVLCARPAINSLLPRDQVNLAEWGLFWQRKGQLENVIDHSLTGQINPNSLRKFGETIEKCLKEYGADRPPMRDVLWDLEYALQLQQTGVDRGPFEDSTTDALGLPMPVVRRLPSSSFTDVSMSMAMEDSSDAASSEVFSQLRIDNPR